MKLGQLQNTEIGASPVPRENIYSTSLVYAALNILELKWNTLSKLKPTGKFFFTITCFKIMYITLNMALKDDVKAFKQHSALAQI